jgi:AmiR/NasT family two-component response regulator
MDSRAPEPLRVLIANERKERLQTTTGLVAAMGHEVIARSLEVSQVAAATAQTRPDVALVGLGESSQHALDLISRIVQEAACPVIAILETSDPEFVNEAAKRGVFAYITDGDPEELQSAIDIVLRRFAEYHNLEGAFGRRVLTERAMKGAVCAEAPTALARDVQCERLRGAGGDARIRPTAGAWSAR